VPSGETLAGTASHAPPPGRERGQDSALLSLEEAIGCLPRETVALFQERLRGQFREVRIFRPRLLEDGPGVTVSDEPEILPESEEDPVVADDL
jgi:hypothetical protein